MKCPNHKFDRPELPFSLVEGKVKGKFHAQAFCPACCTVYVKPIKVVKLPADE